MKSPLKFLAALVAVCFVNLAAFAADAASPTGTWKWTQAGRDGGQSFERKIQLELKDDKLTGKMLAGDGPMGAMPETAIIGGSFKDGTVAFSVTREFGGNSFTIKYQAKLDGDTLKGTSEFPGFDGGEPTKRDWIATRTK
ncbi:MAG: hypothetical protein EXS38_08575 [Opitutus sp.]|nr:hypothetical protein [Opitutus sp.]